MTKAEKQQNVVRVGYAFFSLLFSMPSSVVSLGSDHFVLCNKYILGNSGWYGRLKYALSLCAHNTTQNHKQNSTIYTRVTTNRTNREYATWRFTATSDDDIMHEKKCEIVPKRYEK